MALAALSGASSTTIVLQVARFATNLGVSMVLARLLSPEDFGLNGMAMAVIGLPLLFKDAGIESAMLTKQTISREDIARLAAFNATFGLVLCALCAGLAPVLVKLYGEPRLLMPILVFCPVFALHGLAVPPGVNLLRAGRFRTHASIEFGGIAAGLAAALAMAASGAGYWSLFAVEIVSSLVILLGFTYASKWRPSFLFDWQSVRSFLVFGRDLSLVRALGQAARNIDQLIIGAFLGPVPLAFYAKAFRLVNLPQEGANWPLTRIAVSQLSKQAASPEDFRAVFRRYNFISAAIGMPCVVLLLVSTESIVRLLYGPRWEPVVPLVRILGAMGFINTFMLGAAWVFVASDNMKRQVAWEILNLVVLTLSFCAGLRWGVTGVAVAACSAYLLLRIPSLLYCFKGTPLRLSDLGLALWRPALAAAIALVVSLLVRSWVCSGLPMLACLSIEAASVACAYLLGWVCIPGWRVALVGMSNQETSMNACNRS